MSTHDMLDRPAARARAARLQPSAPRYLSGFGNSFETEALPGALPIGRNSPQRVNYGLYAEQLSGSPFTAPQASNQRSWLYRIRPTVRHAGRFARIDQGLIRTAPTHEHMFNADGELLVVAQENGLIFRTEFGVIEIKPGEVCVIPRGVIFRVELSGGPARAYVCENYGAGFTLPDRGPIGATCLATRRDFETPVAAYEDRDEPSVLFV